MAKQIGEILVEKKLLTSEELNRALLEQGNKGEFLGDTLMKMGAISEGQLLQAFSEQLNIPFINLKETLSTGRRSFSLSLGIKPVRSISAPVMTSFVILRPIPSFP